MWLVHTSSALNSGGQIGLHREHVSVREWEPLKVTDSLMHADEWISGLKMKESY